MADEPDPLSDEEQQRRRQAIKGIFPPTPFMWLLGISFDRYEPDDVVVRLPFPSSSRMTARSTTAG